MGMYLRYWTWAGSLPGLLMSLPLCDCFMESGSDQDHSLPANHLLLQFSKYLC